MKASGTTFSRTGPFMSRRRPATGVSRESLPTGGPRKSATDASLPRRRASMSAKDASFPRGRARMNVMGASPQRGRAPMSLIGAPPQGGRASMSEMHAPPQKGGARMSEMHAPPQKGWARMSEMHAPPQKGGARMSEMHAPPQRGWARMSDIHAPPPRGDAREHEMPGLLGFVDPGLVNVTASVRFVHAPLTCAHPTLAVNKSPPCRGKVAPQSVGMASGGPVRPTPFDAQPSRQAPAEVSSAARHPPRMRLRLLHGQSGPRRKWAL